jgi:hypothetical protein
MAGEDISDSRPTHCLRKVRKNGGKFSASATLVLSNVGDEFGSFAGSLMEIRSEGETNDGAKRGI